MTLPRFCLVYLHSGVDVLFCVFEKLQSLPTSPGSVTAAAGCGFTLISTGSFSKADLIWTGLGTSDHFDLFNWSARQVTDAISALLLGEQRLYLIWFEVHFSILRNFS